MEFYLRWHGRWARIMKGFHFLGKLTVRGFAKVSHSQRFTVCMV